MAIIRDLWRRLIGTGVQEQAPVQQDRVQPLQTWEEQNVCVALEPPVLGRKDATFRVRFHCGSMLRLRHVFYEHVKAAVMSHNDWLEIESDIRRIVNLHGYYAPVLAIFIASNDVWLAGRIQQDRELFEHVVSVQVEYAIGAQVRRGSSYVDAYTVLLDYGVFNMLFGAPKRTFERATSMA